MFYGQIALAVTIDIHHSQTQSGNNLQQLKISATKKDYFNFARRIILLFHYPNLYTWVRDTLKYKITIFFPRQGNKQIGVTYLNRRLQKLAVV